MYLIDSNIFIEAKRRYYGFDICPGFWDWLAGAGARDIAASIEMVELELKAGKGEISDWAAARPDFFLKPDGGVLTSLGRTSRWAVDQEGLKRIKIPSAASALGVPTIDIFALLRREGAEFVWNGAQIAA